MAIFAVLLFILAIIIIAFYIVSLVILLIGVGIGALVEFVRELLR